MTSILADKLLQTKLREKEIKEALKEQRSHEKQEKEEERLEAAEAARFERAFHQSSKRFAKDERMVGIDLLAVIRPRPSSHK